MKLKTTLLAATLIAFAASTAYAADDAMTKKADTPRAESNAGRSDHEMMQKHVPMQSHKQDRHSAKKGLPAVKSKAGKSKMMEKHAPMQDHAQDKN